MGGLGGRSDVLPLGAWRRRISTYRAAGKANELNGFEIPFHSPLVAPAILLLPGNLLTPSMAS